MKIIIWIFLLFLLQNQYISAQKVTHLVSKQKDNIIIITYNLETINPCKITLYVSTDGGKNWDGPLKMVKGDVGDNVKSGENHIFWSVLDEYKELRGDNIKFQVKTDLDYPMTIENSKLIRIGRIEIAQYDFPNRMSWENAKIACNKLGDGWRLPNKHELSILYKNKIMIGGFGNYYYWSSSKSFNGKAWKLFFFDGKKKPFRKDYRCVVRAVRTL